jgi:hypothetical protein
MAKKVIKQTTPAKGSPKNPIALKAVVVSAPKKKAYTSRGDSTAVGYAGKYKNVADKDLKQVVKNKQMSSIDTTSKGSMSRTAYGKDPSMVADLVKRNKDSKK